MWPILLLAGLGYVFYHFRGKKEEEGRYSLLPIRYGEMWQLFKKQEGHFWTTESVDLTQDVLDWKELSPKLKGIYEKVFANFNVFDRLVNQNIEDISHDLPKHYLEAECFYKAQEFMECIHMEFYGTLIETIIPDPETRLQLLTEAEKSGYIRKKIELTQRRRKSSVDLGERIIANGCVEAVGFSSLFACIFWLKTVNKLPGTRFGNEEVILDESIHVEGSVRVYKDMVADGKIKRLSKEQVKEIMDDFVGTEIECIEEIIGEGEKDLNVENMKKYIRFVADHYSGLLGYGKLYGDENPFPFMDMTSLMTKSNFFEKRVAEYKQFQKTDKNDREIVTNLEKKF